MFNNKIRAAVINMERDVAKKEEIIEQMKCLNIAEYDIPHAIEMKDVQFNNNGHHVVLNNKMYEYGIYTGDFPFRKQHLSEHEIGCALSNHLSRNNQKDGYYTIIFEDDARFIGNYDTWSHYIDHLPPEDDYDIIFLSDCAWRSQPYPQANDYNDYYYFLPHPFFDISGTHAYIVNSKTLDLLNTHFNLRLPADDYLNYCINKFKLRTLVSKEILFTQRPMDYKQAAVTKNYKILFYNKMWGMDDSLSNIPREEGFELLTDHKYLRDADVVVFHMPTLPKGSQVLNKEFKKEGQLWVFWSMECEAHYEWQYDPAVLNLFDITMTYKLDSAIPVPYLDPQYQKLLRRQPGPKTGLANAFISSSFDGSGRIKYLNELMNYLDIHSYGKVLNNRSIDNDEGAVTKEKIMSSYKFTLAFENAIARDYVTEKFFHPLVVGSIPVYLGAPNIKDFSPGDRCYIDVNDFSSARELAKYILALDRNEARYQEYLTWKNLPFRDAFNAKLTVMARDPFNRLYDLIKKRLQEKIYQEKKFPLATGR